MDRLFGALSNPIRRDILDMLRAGERSVLEIAGHFDMARQSVSEHLKVLVDVGLVVEEQRGRYRYYTVQAEPLQHLIGWLSPYEQFWRGRLTAMRKLLDDEAATPTKPGSKSGDWTTDEATA